MQLTGKWKNGYDLAPLSRTGDLRAAANFGVSPRGRRACVQRGGSRGAFGALGRVPIGPAHLVRLAVLSTRADLVSGGEALVQVVLPPGARAAQTRLDVTGRDVTSEFALLSSGNFEGLVTGLANGPNVLTARLPDGYGAHLTITNHPVGGPILSGPQLEPWGCESGAVDAACN